MDNSSEICWFCHWGWPVQIASIYRDALAKLDGDGMPLLYGPAHVVWEDENFDMAQWCLDNFDEHKGANSEAELAIVRESLERLVAVADEYKHEPESYPGREPKNYPPPEHWIMDKVNG